MESLTTQNHLTQAQTRLWVDTDITIGHHDGLKLSDVDDGYALGVLLRSQEVDIVGVSSTLGNTNDIKVSTQIATEFISQFGPTSLSVSQGSHCFFAQATEVPDAVKQLAEQLQQGSLTILAIGALTNIALLFKHYPELISRIDELVCLAGRRDVKQHFVASKHQPRPFRDLNFEVDEAAFQVILNSDVKLSLVPFEACETVWINFSELRRLGKNSDLSRYLGRHSLAWCLEWETVFGAKDGFIPFDMVAAAYVINRQWFQLEQWQVCIENAASDTSKNENKDYLICNDSVKNGKSVSYATAISSKAEPELLSRISQQDVSGFILGLSHINIIVEDVDTAAEYYNNVLGFERAIDAQGNKMDYRNVEMAEFTQDAGLAGQEVKVDVLFLKHPYASIYLELMRYHQPIGSSTLPVQPKTYDLGGPRHIALEVSNCTAVFNYLKQQEGVSMINPAADYHPEKLDGFPISFFYWIDKYGVQWEMEEGRRVGNARGII